MIALNQKNFVDELLKILHKTEWIDQLTIRSWTNHVAILINASFPKMAHVEAVRGMDEKKQ